ncbi:helix-turn-helix domain-containing protein [Salinarchaeum laminariae]|uniref:helix-turn-helix domain-containing protein n=1 Tax=Salinarchaeum laminariae TaxID=869888 RepID=UPI0020C1208F|nr:helix-turn-helix domain-containing protein [Salinarchaeum laminariae]
MGRQRTGDDRSLLDDDSTISGTSGETDQSAAGRSSRTDDRTATDGGASQGRNGIWDSESFGRSDDAQRGGPDNGSSLVTDREQTAEEQATVEVEPEDELIRVDLDKLTDRQLEVLETAHDLGYYQYPRGANASEVAEALDICPSTLAEHLAAAQTKLLADVLGEDETR